MDFSALIQIAKQNRENTKDEGKYYKTKLAPPKKETKESRRLSENIQKFLQKREQEERQKDLEQKRKVAELLAKRDEKSKNKIRKMLKVTKSANKSVLEDAVNETHTAVTLSGLEQPDQDDYGYVSTTANAFYQKYIEKVKDVHEDKGFAPNRPQSIKDLSGTKERVKAAIKEKQLPVNGERKRTKSSSIITSHSSSADNKVQTKLTLYDPEHERRDEERKREEQRKKAKQRRPAALPPMDFRELLKLAEKKQHEPIEIVQEVKKEPERLLTSKEKRELEDQKRAREARLQRERDIKEGRIKPFSNKTSTPKSGSNATNSTINKVEERNRPASESNVLKKPTATTSVNPTKGNMSANARTSSISSKTNNAIKPAAAASSDAKSKTINAKTPYNGLTREFPPKPISNGAAKREVAPSKARMPEAQKTRQFPPADVRRSATYGASSSRGDDRSKMASKRRIIDDDDDEYDSEMDDFIDDGEEDADYSSAIRDIFGYDKAKYRHLDDEDDAAMESNFAQMQREEYISKKIGLQEDLEDMRLEALEKEKKRKLMKRRRLE